MLTIESRIVHRKHHWPDGDVPHSEMRKLAVVADKLASALRCANTGPADTLLQKLIDEALKSYNEF